MFDDEEATQKRIRSLHLEISDSEKHLQRLRSNLNRLTERLRKDIVPDISSTPSDVLQSEIRFNQIKKYFQSNGQALADGSPPLNKFFESILARINQEKKKENWDELRTIYNYINQELDSAMKATRTATGKIKDKISED